MTDAEALDDQSESYPSSTSGIAGNLSGKSLTLTGLSSCDASMTQRCAPGGYESAGPGVSGPVSDEELVRSKIDNINASSLPPLAISSEDSRVLRTISAMISWSVASSGSRIEGRAGPLRSRRARWASRHRAWIS